jgi:hypothetical protein
MRLHPLTVLAFTAFLWEYTVSQQTCSPQTSCAGCLFVKDGQGITSCGWCRNSNITSQPFCADRTLSSIGDCTGTYTSEGTTRERLVLDSAQCEVATSQNTLIAAVAGSVGGVLFAVAIIYVYYRKKKQKQERLATFRRRELEMHRNRKLKLDKEMGMQAGAASINQRQLATQQLTKQSMEGKHADVEVEVFDAVPPEPELLKVNRRRFKCMSKGGLRVRESPNSESAKVGGIKFEVVVTALSVKGNWVQVSANGWAMITSDDGGKVFLKELGEGDDADEPPPPAPEIVG